VHSPAQRMLKVSADELQIIRAILAEHVPQYEVMAFGSRISGNPQRFSDLDIAIISDSPISFELLGRLRDAFSESDLPYKIDVIDWASTSEGFRQIIMEKAQQLQPVS
jgi:predicted nucleotidyltransferase